MSDTNLVPVQLTREQCDYLLSRLQDKGYGSSGSGSSSQPQRNQQMEEQIINQINSTQGRSAATGR